MTRNTFALLIAAIIIAVLGVSVVLAANTAAPPTDPLATIQDKDTGGACPSRTEWLEVDGVTPVAGSNGNDFGTDLEVCRNPESRVSTWEDEGTLRIKYTAIVETSPGNNCFFFNFEDMRRGYERNFRNGTPQNQDESDMENGDLSHSCNADDGDTVVLEVMECRDQPHPFDDSIVIGDILQVNGHFGESSSHWKFDGHINVDLNEDGSVVIGDIQAVVAQFGGTCGGFLP